MITVTVTSGNQVEGLRISDDIVDALMGHLTDTQKVAAVNDALRSHIALTVAFNENQSLPQAASYTWQNMPKVD